MTVSLTFGEIATVGVKQRNFPLHSVLPGDMDCSCRNYRDLQRWYSRLYTCFLVDGFRSIQVVIDREQWIKEAEEAEKAGAPLTCGAIVRATVHIGVEEEDRKRYTRSEMKIHTELFADTWKGT